MSELLKKERQAIRLLKTLGNTPVEVSFSGGKDSEVILALAQMAGLNYTAIHKNTTIDPKGTIAHCLSKGCKILQPKENFFELVARKGLPSRFVRFCCSELKEYKVMDKAIQGIRRSESVKRAKLYKEPVDCRIYGKKDERVEIFFPILEWTDDDVKQFIESNNIQCHPLYYDCNGKFEVKRRLGCIGCPLQTDNGVAELKANPNILRAYFIAMKKYWDKSREQPTNTQKRCADIYEWFYFSKFCHSYADFQEKKAKDLFGNMLNCKQFLEEYFQITL